MNSDMHVQQAGQGKHGRLHASGHLQGMHRHECMWHMNMRGSQLLTRTQQQQLGHVPESTCLLLHDKQAQQIKRRNTDTGNLEERRGCRHMWCMLCGVRRGQRRLPHTRQSQHADTHPHNHASMHFKRHGLAAAGLQCSRQIAATRTGRETNKNTGRRKTQ